MDTITIRGKKYRITGINKSGVISELPGEIIGGKLLTNGLGGELKLYDAIERDGLEPILAIACEKGRQDNEEIFREAKRYEGGLAAKLEGPDAEALIYHQPFDATEALYRILKLLEKQFAPQWVHIYKFNLDSAETDHLIGQFPTKPNYIYVQTCSGTVTMKFHSQNEPSWTLAAKDQFRMPFEQIYLTWTAQEDKRLILYISNKEIKKTTLA